MCIRDRCGSSARWDLCGGPPVRAVPTATGGSTAAPNLPQSYAPLTRAFLGLVATSLNYAIVAGDQSNSGRNASLETAGGVGFAVAGAMLVFSILILLHAVERDEPESTGTAVSAASVDAQLKLA